jgi:GTPase SAR1 family protein
MIKHQMEGVGKTHADLKTHEDILKGNESLVVNTSKDVTVKIIDCGTRDEDLLIKAIRKVDGFMLVYNITDKSSFEAIQDIQLKLFANVALAHIPIILVGTQIDRESKRQVTEIMLQDLAKDFMVDRGVPYEECSSKTGENVEKAFLEMVREIDRGREFNIGAQNSLGSVQPKKNIIQRLFHL